MSRTRDVPTYIYTLSDPDTGAVHYVGATVDPGHRITQLQRSDYRMARRLREWIGHLSVSHAAPLMTVVRAVPAGGDWRGAEREIIISHLAAGCDLFNSQHAGGPRQSIVWAIPTEVPA